MNAFLPGKICLPACLLAAFTLAATPARAQLSASTVRSSTSGGNAATPDAPRVASTRRLAPAVASLSEWEWNFQHFVRVGSPEPATLDETVRVGFGNHTESYLRVTFRARSAPGFPAGSFRGRKEVSFTMERLYSKLTLHAGKFLAEPGGPFRLVESDPPDQTLADLSTLGGIVRGPNIVATVGDAFRGENLFVPEGEELTFVNQQYLASRTHDFPAQITLEPVK